MKFLNQKDILSSIATGLTTGLIAWRVLVFLGKSLPFGILPSTLPLLVPLLWLLGVQLGYALEKTYEPFAQFGKFAAIGFANAAVDFGVLYLLIAETGKADGLHYTLFKSASFAVAVVHSYLWNKYWAFDSWHRSTTRNEVLSFAAVSLFSFAVNVSIATAIVRAGPFSGFDVYTWAGIAAFFASVVSLVISFVGFRLFVFAKK